MPGIHVDYAGTSAHSGYGINVPFCYTDAYTAVRRALHRGPAILNNAGSLATVTVSAPEGSILHAPRPERRHGAACGGPDAARPDVRLPAPGDGRRHAGRGRGQPVGHAAVRRPGHRAGHPASQGHHALHR
jgi:hypothetical protein